MLDRLRAWAVVVGLVVMKTIAIWFHGLRSGQQQRDDEAREENLKTHERIHDADTGRGDPDDDREWLRKRGQ